MATAYPENKLTDSAVKSSKPKEKLYRLRDGGALSLDVMPNGSKIWRYAYRLHDKQKTFTLGHYPDMTLSQARELRNEARKLVSAGTDPVEQRRYQQVQVEHTSFAAVAADWLEHNRAGWADGNTVRIEGYLNRDILPALGRMDTASIQARDIIPIIKRVRDRGAVDAAKRVKGWIQHIFDYAVVHGFAERNPAKDIDVKLILPKRVKGRFAAVTEPGKVGQLLRDIDGYQGGLAVRSVLALSPLVFLRPAEIRLAEWAEVDRDAALWTLPARRRKLPTHIKQADRPEDALLVPLSRQALAVLQELHEYTGRGQYLFPSNRGQGRPLSNNAVRVALRTMGYENDDMTAHGFRALASTLLNELGYRSEVIEAQLGHKDKDKIRAAYNRAKYLQERTTMMQAWADYLDGLRTGGEVVPIRRKGA
ncbi:MAG: integrase arm-type DNA-binding domain-containing protein [Thiothrix sp.]|nr:integrase arm-type DNA-binding domain-containing protein [Thiothrix sp.]HPQ95117.1 integrase arm-type DNA-binding domain-containing protein [Thiolinea sp.]